MGGNLPEGVIPHPNGTLVFGRPLSLSDAGTYQCEAKNEVGTGKADVEITVAGRCQHGSLRLVMVTYTVRINVYIHVILSTPLLTLCFTESEKEESGNENMLMIIIGAVAGGLLILMLIIIISVTCYHKRKNQKLKKELTERKYAENT